VPYFGLLVGESLSVINCSRSKLLPAATQSHPLYLLCRQLWCNNVLHSLTLKGASF